MLKKYLIQFSKAFFLLYAGCCYSQSNLNSIALYYGNNLPLDELHAFNVVVVTPHRDIVPTMYDTKHSKLFAYVSIGEVNRELPYANHLPPQCIIGRNQIWKSKIVDQGKQICRNYYIDKIIAPLWKRGYRGVFLDTLDSYRLIKNDKQTNENYVDGLISLITIIKQRYPKMKIILNGGFELLPKTHKLIYAVAAESLYRGWDQKQMKYVMVPKNRRNWLLLQLQKAKKYGLTAISIDYLPPNKRKESRLIAKKILAHGIMPWVTDSELRSLGVGAVEVMPRKILVFYDSSAAPSLMQQPALQYGAMPLEYLGYVPIFRDVHTFNYSNAILKGRYAGILVWLGSEYLQQTVRFQLWLAHQVKQGVPLVILGDFGYPLSSKFSNLLGINIKAKYASATKVTITKKTGMIGYEITPPINPIGYYPVYLKHGNVQLKLKDNLNRIGDAVAITTWGGYAINPFVTFDLPNGQVRWAINPLQFFRKAFGFKPLPIPDITTENGRRLMMVHVDGDGFANKGEWYHAQFSGEILLKQILEHYKIPTTVSIIQAEIGPNGLYPKHSDELTAIARRIFQLPWVEIASHSFSHPFQWQKLSTMNDAEIAKNKNLYLAVPNYKFNIRREITGSIAYINNNLSSSNKRCKVFLWTGDCNPPANAVALTYQDNVGNMNGGDTTITNTNKSLTNIAPLGVYKGKYFQVFSPDQNENIYTNLWTGPFYGYRSVIETFKLTDKPIRFKPIDIYYHFYSATKQASLQALRSVYDWALKQRVFNIYASEYIKKVLDFNHLVIAKIAHGWLIRGRGELREFRLPKNITPEVGNGTNVVGFNTVDGKHYIHVGDKRSTYINQTNQVVIPYIVDANGRVTKFISNGDKILFELKGYLPLKFTLSNIMHYQVVCNGQKLTGINSRYGSKQFSLSNSTAATCTLQRIS